MGEAGSFAGWRVAQLLTSRGRDQPAGRGSGYLIAPGVVLTAAHVLTDAVTVDVLQDVGHAEQITVTDGQVVVVGPGRGTLGNLVRSPAVTLVFPPRQPKGFTLLVDGTGEVSGEDVRVTPTGAVLHRPASHADGPPPPASSVEDCDNDCVPVTDPA